jgi:hypothetical protein
MNNSLLRLAILSVVALAPTWGYAQNLLSNGDLANWSADVFQDLPDDWTLVTDPSPPTRYPALKADFADHSTRPNSIYPDNFGLWYLPFEGDYPGYPDVIFVDADLTQTVPGTPGQKYTFFGWALFEQNYAGGVDTIHNDPDPMNTFQPTRKGLPSLTDTFFSLEFLDGLSNEISTVDVELRADGQVNGAGWMRHVLSGVAPAGTAFVRVRANMVDGEFNVDPQQSAFVDDFTLLAVPEPASGMLALVSLAALGMIRRRS